METFCTDCRIAYSNSSYRNLVVWDYYLFELYINILNRWCYPRKRKKPLVFWKIIYIFIYVYKYYVSFIQNGVECINYESIANLSFLEENEIVHWILFILLQYEFSTYRCCDKWIWFRTVIEPNMSWN